MPIEDLKRRREAERLRGRRPCDLAEPWRAGGLDEEELRIQILEALLEVLAEAGERDCLLAAVLERCGGCRGRFHRHLAGLEKCYASAYQHRAERLIERLGQPAGGQSDRRRGRRAALEGLAAFRGPGPRRARGPLAEVSVAPSATALAKREEVIGRLSHAIDSARRENLSRHSPPPITAPSMVGAIDDAVLSDLLGVEAGSGFGEDDPLSEGPI